MPRKQELSPFLKRPSFFQDEGIQNQYHIDFVTPFTGKDVVKDTEVVDNLISYLQKLDLESPGNLKSINEVREDLVDSEKLKEEIAKKMQESSPSESGSGEGTSSEDGMDLGGEENASGFMG